MRKQIAEVMSQRPEIQKAAMAMAQAIEAMGIPHEDVEQFLQIAEMALKSPQQWPEIRARVSQSGIIPEGFLPQEYSPPFLMTLIAALELAVDRAHGALTQVENGAR